MSVGRLQLRLVFGWVILLVLLCDGLLLVIESVRLVDLGLGLCKSRIRGFRSQYIHMFNIIDVLWL